MAYGKIKADTLVYDNSGSDVEVTLSSLGNKANLASPTFTGTPAAPTAAANTNTTQIATTAYVQTELGDYATKASPTFTGTVAIPTPSSGDNSTKAASTAFVVAGFTAKPATEGTVGASEAVVVDGNKDTTGIRNLTISGNLQVNGTTTTVASSTMTVADKNIELAKGAANDAAADGGGITLESGDGNKTITWTNATDTWDFNQNISIINPASSGDAFLNIIGGEGGASVIEFKADEGDDNADYWRVQNAGDGILGFRTKASGSWVEEFRVETTGITVNGSVTDSKGDVRSIPQLSKSSAHTIVAADAGQHSINSSGGWVINTSTGFTAGQAITLINNSSGDQTITSTGVTLYNSADGSTPTKLATRGMATVICTASNTYYISGAGLS